MNQLEKTVCFKCIERIRADADNNDLDLLFHDLCRPCKRRMEKLRNKAMKYRNSNLKKEQREQYLDARYREMGLYR